MKSGVIFSEVRFFAGLAYISVSLSIVWIFTALSFQPALKMAHNYLLTLVHPTESHHYLHQKGRTHIIYRIDRHRRRRQNRLHRIRILLRTSPRNTNRTGKTHRPQTHHHDRHRTRQSRCQHEGRQPKPPLPAVRWRRPRESRILHRTARGRERSGGYTTGTGRRDDRDESHGAAVGGGFHDVAGVVGEPEDDGKSGGGSFYEV